MYIYIYICSCPDLRIKFSRGFLHCSGVVITAMYPNPATRRFPKLYRLSGGRNRNQKRCSSSENHKIQKSGTFRRG